MIRILRVKHKDQRYETWGDWQFDGFGNLTIKVSDPQTTAVHPDDDVKKHHIKYAPVLIALHEMIEAYLCQANGVTEQMVDEWDLAHLDHPDPGAIPGCPYYVEHMFATMIERIFAHELDIDWDLYDAVMEGEI